MENTVTSSADQFVERMDPSMDASPRPPAAASTLPAGAPALIAYGDNQRETLAALNRAFANPTLSVALTGPAGTGKTALLRSALAGAASNGLQVFWIDKPGLVDDAETKRIARLVFERSTTEASGGRSAILVVDGAEGASPALLRGLARLPATSWEGRRPPQIVLSGRPDLWSRLADDELGPLAERLVLRLDLKPLDDQAAHDFIEHLFAQPRRVRGQGLAPDAEREIVREANGHAGRISELIHETLTALDARARAPISLDDVSMAIHGAPSGTKGGASRTSSLSSLLMTDQPMPHAASPAATPRADKAAWRSAQAWSSERIHAMPPKYKAIAAAAVALLATTAIGGALLSHGSPPSPAPATIRPVATTEIQAPTADAAMAERTVPAAAAPGPSTTTTTAANDAETAGPQEQSRPIRVWPSQTWKETARAEPPMMPAPPAPPLSQQEAAPATPGITQSVPQAPTAPSSFPATDYAPRPRDTRPAPAFTTPAAAPAVPTPAPAAPAFPIEPPSTIQAAPLAGAPVPLPSFSRLPRAEERPASPPDASPAAISQKTLAALLRRGDELLANGDPVGARRFYERAATGGFATGMLGMARSFDTGVLGEDSAANATSAAIWYTRAAAAGNADAATRLKQLEKGR